ncbi:MAG TPA: N-acetyl-D-Glu racemase DgcA [Terriglobales bacterium]|nr:N-acetyl-D-Glu racemase DgcA [Terriglobales bacterium]
MSRKLTIRHESWPIAGTFTISRGSKTSAEVVVVEFGEGKAKGHGECVPYGRYGESIEGVIAAIEQHRVALEDGADRAAVQKLLAPGAARNAVDCALWDLEAKLAGKPVWKLAGLKQPRDLMTAYTLSLAAPDEMALAAAKNLHRPLLKLKLSGADDLDRVRAVSRAAPQSKLIIDANEGWSIDDYRKLAPKLRELNVILIEQPLPAGNDEALREVEKPIPICADEACHDSETLAALVGKYQAVNIKLDKTGGLTEALKMAKEAERLGFRIMVGCMVGSSLGMAPAFLIGQQASYVDLDGPLLLAKDREHGFRFDGSFMHPCDAALWG